jgi:hypothetical protein
LHQQRRISKQDLVRAAAPTRWIALPFRLYDYRDAATAVATIFIALFTLTLWRATVKLGESGQKSFEATERAFVFLDGVNYELTTFADGKADIESIPQWYRSDPGLLITRFAAQPRWKNGGNTPTRKMTIQVDWCDPPKPIPPTTFTEIPRSHFSLLRRPWNLAQ